MKESAPDWAVIPDKVPWITGTPQAHLASNDLSRATPPQDLALPPAPTLPPPPTSTTVSPLSEAETAALTHLRGLATVMALPDEMAQQMAMLTQKEREAGSGKSLNHTHLHKLNRIKGQVATTEKKVKALDAEWMAFVEQVISKLKFHGQCYQQCRADLLEAFNKKVEEFIAAKQDVSTASQLLLGQSHLPEATFETPDVSADFSRLQQMLEQASTVEPIHIGSESGDMCEEDMENAEEEEFKSSPLKPAKSTSYRQVTVAPFSKATSPSKVHQGHLKQVQAKDARVRKEDRSAPAQES